MTESFIPGILWISKIYLKIEWVLLIYLTYWIFWNLTSIIAIVLISSILAIKFEITLLRQWYTSRSIASKFSKLTALNWPQEQSSWIHYEFSKSIVHVQMILQDFSNLGLRAHGLNVQVYQGFKRVWHVSKKLNFSNQDKEQKTWN